jgi:adenylate cyclase
VLVLPLASLGEGAEPALYAAGLSEEILARLSQFKELTVLRRELGGEANAGPRATTQTPFPRYVLAGSLRASGPELRVASRLEDSRTGLVLWARTYEADLRTTDLFSIQEEIALQVAAAVAQPYGVVFRSDLLRTAAQAPASLDPYACTLRFYVYRAEPNPGSHAHIRECLERAVEHFPDSATAWAMLSLLALDEDRFAFNPRPGAADPIERALRAAQRAVDLDADNARALQALMMALFFRGEVEQGIRVGRRALANNPNDTELLSEFGVRLALAGERRHGRDLVEQALARDPAYSGYYHAALALIAYLQRDYEFAESEIRQADLSDFSIYHVVAAMIYAERGLMDAAKQEAALFMKLHPRFMANLDAEMHKRNLRPEDRSHMIESMLKAGLPVPTESTEPIVQRPTSS